MKRPLLAVAFGYSAGILLADQAAVLPSPFLLLGLGAACGLLALGWARARPALVWVFIVTVGGANLAQRKAVLAPDDLRTLLGEQTAIASIRGTLAETPSLRAYEHHEEIAWRTIARVDVRELRTTRDGWRPAFGQVTISTPGTGGAQFFGGRSVEIEGVIRPPRSAVAEGLFDYRAFLARQGVYYQLQVESTNDWRLAPTGVQPLRHPVADRFGDWARRTLARGLPVEDRPLQLLWTMTLGWKTALSGEVAEPFMRSGTMHIFAISGLHVALIAGLLVALLKVCGVPRARCAWIVVPLVWFYAGATGWQASAVRSTIMMTVIIGGWALKRPSDLVNSLAGAAFIILLWDPQQLFQAGFQLSFLVVLSLALLVPRLEAVHRSMIEPHRGDRNSAASHPVRDWLVARAPFAAVLLPDPWIPEDLRPRWQRWVGVPVRHFIRASTTSLAAWLGAIPVVAWYFHLLTPVSLLANLLVVPLSSVALACAFASMTVGSVVPFAGELFNHSAWLLMLLMIRLSEWAAQLPGACVNVAAPAWSLIALYYAALISVASGWLFRPRWRLGTAVFLAALAVFAAWDWRSRLAAAELTLVPLAGGEAICFRPAGGGQEMIVDCGNESSAEFVLKPFLRSRGVNHLHSMVISHGDVRAAGGAGLIQEQFPAREVVISGSSFRSQAYREAVAKFEATPGLLRRVQRGDTVAQWKVLHPDASDRFAKADDQAIVLYGEIEGLRILLLSDLGNPGQSALCARYPDLRADIVISGVPAEGEPLAEALLAALAPRLIVVADAEYPASQRASRTLRARLERHEADVLFLHETGAIRLRLLNGQVQPLVMNPPAHAEEP